MLCIVTTGLTAIGQQPSTGAAPGSADDLIGLWKAKKRFGPDAGGPLTIQRSGTGYVADMMGYRVPVNAAGGEFNFALPDQMGRFRGKFAGKNITGHWYQPGTLVNGGDPSTFSAASYVLLSQASPGRWNGTVTPLADDFTFYLMAEKRVDGTIGVLLRNPERDLGNMMGFERLTRQGDDIKLMGRRRGEKAERELASGRYDHENQVLTIYIPNRGLSYDFMRDGDESGFYSRGKAPGKYTYLPPLALDDGWPTGNLDDAGLDQAAIEKLIQTVSATPETAPDTPQIHGIVIARHGKLVLEEYFHGFNRDMLHNTRSASKSVTATIVGAAMYAGIPLTLSSPVYQVMNGGKFPADLDEQKRAMTLEHLLTMTSGIFCDDSNSSAPGNENGMWDQTAERDFYRFYMRQPMDRKPGEKPVYCSGDPNLALGTVGSSAGEDPLYLFDRLLGAPMKIDRYAWDLDPAGHPYGGGGVAFRLRDFAKFGQLMLNGGTWGGRRLLGPDFVKQAASPLRPFGTNTYNTYGYLWWGTNYEYQGRKVHAFAALGAGGQNVIVVPELDLVLACFNGSFATRGYRRFSDELVPGYILPAVRPGAGRR